MKSIVIFVALVVLVSCNVEDEIEKIIARKVLNSCTGGKYEKKGAYVKVDYAPIKLCQQSCEGFATLPMCSDPELAPKLKGGCICADGYKRNHETNNCIPEKKCVEVLAGDSESAEWGASYFDY